MSDMLTAGQIVDGVDEFYKDFKNRSILVTWAVEIAVRQIAGEDVNALSHSNEIGISLCQFRNTSEMLRGGSREGTRSNTSNDRRSESG